MCPKGPVTPTTVRVCLSGGVMDEWTGDCKEVMSNTCDKAGVRLCSSSSVSYNTWPSCCLLHDEVVCVVYGTQGWVDMRLVRVH